MISIIDFQKRALTGPVMKADEFDLEFSMKLRELVAKYEIKYDPEMLIVDDATADAVFQAGVELLADVGLYHIETERVIKYTKEEVETIAREYREHPRKHTFGKGKDEVTVEYRTGADTRPPIQYSGPAGVADEEWFGHYVQSYVQEESVKAMGICPGLAKLGDIEPKAGAPSEIYVAQWEQKQIKETLERVGRPDMHCGLLATVSTVGGTMAMIGPGLREAHNTQIGIHILPEQKIDWARLLLAQFCQDRGIVPWQSTMSMIGGLCRDAADTAVSLVANLLGQISYGHGPLNSLFTNHMDGNWGTPACFWAYSAAARASERNIKVCIGGTAVAAMHRCLNDAQMLHVAAGAILHSASGMSYCWLSGGTGFDAAINAEVMDVTAGMPAEKANELVQKILTEIDKIEPGEMIMAVPFPDIYDIQTMKPKPDYEKMILGGKDVLARLGVPFK